jgi:DNA-binding NarL/FixJ family response regulator
MTPAVLAALPPTDDPAPPRRLTLIRGGAAGSETIRVAVAAGQAVVRAGCRFILGHEECVEVIGEATDAEQAVDLARGMGPVVVLMDVDLPGADGVEATRRLVDEPGVTVVVLSGSESDPRILSALYAGASGVLLRGFEPHELIQTVEVVAAGGAVLPPYVARRTIVELASPRRPARRRRSLRSARGRQSSNCGTWRRRT